MAKQYIEMLENIYDPETKTKLIKGVKYAITYETDSVYYIGKQGETEFGLSKGDEDKVFKIGSIKTPKPSK